MLNLFSETIVEPRLNSIKKFYFFEYFYIFLKSVSLYSELDEVFNSFKTLRDEHKLAESRFKKFVDTERDVSLQRYMYTFKEVLEECLLYNLVENDTGRMKITEKGETVLNKYQNNDTEQFNLALFKLMEAELHGFYQMVKYCYRVNNSGLLVFPMYSPLKLDMRKTDMKLNGNMLTYINKLTKKLEEDLDNYVSTKRDLSEPTNNIIKKLVETNLLTENPNDKFNLKSYHAIIKRLRDFWINYFLRDIYMIPITLSYFDIWCYRGKQLGIINITEFYYNFDGRIVYPVSIIGENVNNLDFRQIFQYKTGENLYLHEPDPEKYQDKFSSVVYDSYIDLKLYNTNSYFVSIADLRDIVCYKLKISYKTFQDFLEKLYILNLKGQTTVKISLEADTLPEETKVMYQKREPITIEGKFRNIIAIDLKQ